MIDASDYSSLLGILGQKQRILGRLDEVKRRYPDWATNGPPSAIRDAPSPQPLRGLIAETEAILAELVQTEKDGATQLSDAATPPDSNSSRSLKASTSTRLTWTTSPLSITAFSIRTDNTTPFTFRRSNRHVSQTSPTD